MGINVGIIGLGHIGRYHIRALEEFGGLLDLKAVCDTDADMKAIVPGGVRYYRSPEEIFSDGEIKTVIIATPNDTHYPLGLLALKSGKNVIMEKPAATSLENFLDLNNKFNKSSSRHIYYAFHAANAEEVKWLKDKRESMELGPLTSFLCNFYDPYYREGKIISEAESLQNCWIDSGVNALSVLNEFIDVSKLEYRSFSETDINKGEAKFIQASSVFSFPVSEDDSSGLGCMDTNWTLGRNYKRTLLGFALSETIIELDHSLQRVILTDKSGNQEVLADFGSKGERLLNHYRGVFSDYLKSLKKESFNATDAKRIHQKLFTYSENIF